MRVLFVFIAYACSLLLSAEQLPVKVQQNHAITATSQKIEKKHSGKYTNNDQGDNLIEDTDVDLTEDNNLSENLKVENKFPSLKFNASEKWLSANTRQLHLNCLSKGFKTLTPLHSQLPLYISQRVLRI